LSKKENQLVVSPPSDSFVLNAPMSVQESLANAKVSAQQQCMCESS